MTLDFIFLTLAGSGLNIFDNGNFKSVIALAMMLILGFMVFCTWHKGSPEMRDKMFSRIMPIVGMIIAFYFAVRD